MSNCGPWGLVMNQVMENTAMTQEAIYMPQAWAYAQQACVRCKDVNAPWKRIATQQSFNMESQRGGGLTHLSQYNLPYSFGSPSEPAIPGSVGAYYGILPPW